MVASTDPRHAQHMYLAQSRHATGIPQRLWFSMCNVWPVSCKRSGGKGLPKPNSSDRKNIRKNTIPTKNADPSKCR